ncbi:MAG: hypothetical protein ACRCST_06280 [Turicibacter sp.]
MKIVISFILCLLVVIGILLWGNEQEVDFVLLNEPLLFELEQREVFKEE